MAEADHAPQWAVTWSFAIDEKTASRENYGGRTIHGTITLDEEVAACPHCGAAGFVKCGSCGRLTCWGGQDLFECRWCPNQGPVSGQIDSISTAGDR